MLDDHALALADPPADVTADVVRDSGSATTSPG